MRDFDILGLGLLYYPGVNHLNDPRLTVKMLPQQTPGVIVEHHKGETFARQLLNTEIYDILILGIPFNQDPKRELPIQLS